MEKLLEENRLLNEREASKLLSISVHTLRNDRHYHRGVPYIKCGRSVRYRLSDIQSYINENRIDPNVQ